MTAFQNIVNITGFKQAQDKTIPREKMGKILEAGRNTPSPGKVHGLEYVVVEDDHKLERLSQVLGDHRVAEAPATVFVVADVNRMKRRGAPREFCMGEASASIQNMRITAQSEGISSLWKAGFNKQEVSEQLKVPGEKEVMASVTLAYTDDPIHSEPAFGMNTIFYYNEFGNQIKSVFDGAGWKGIRQERRIYDKKMNGLIDKLREKIREAL